MPERVLIRGGIVLPLEGRKVVHDPGSVLIEGIFGWPGIGNYSLQAIQHSDFPAIQGFVLYATILYVLIYETLNSVYALVDPRIRS